MLSLVAAYRNSSQRRTAHHRLFCNARNKSPNSIGSENAGKNAQTHIDELLIK
jgi:hypothetical protein